MTSQRSVVAMAMTFAIVVSAMLFAEAQQPARLSRIGFLSPRSSSDEGRLLAFQQGLRDLGYVEGQNVAIEARWAKGEYDRLPALATELVRLEVDVIVTYSAPAILAAKGATGSIPIVMAGAIDPVASGLVTSLARPGGNITGQSLMAPELVGKQLELLKEVVPAAFRVALLGNPANSGNTPQLQRAQDAARALGMQLQLFEARSASQIDDAFVAMTKQQVEAVIVLVDSMLVDQRARIAALAAKSKRPALYGLSDHPEAGGLMAYGPSVADRFRRAAAYVDKILKGAKPADLPIEQPTRFELVVNLRAARALNLTIPSSILARADHVIQ